MKFTIRQVSDLVQDGVVAERHYSVDTPASITGVLREMLRSCSDYLRSEGIPITQDSHWH